LPSMVNRRRCHERERSAGHCTQGSEGRLSEQGGVDPLIAAPVIILVALPGVAALVPMLGDMFGTGGVNMLQSMPGLQATLAGYDELQRSVVFLLVYMMAPLYLLLPTIVATTIAADSFAGEKERKTLEALLYTPTTDWELLLGKLLSAWLPAVGVAWGGFLLYTVMANLAAWPVMGRLFFPTTMWVILAVWVAPAAAGLGLGTTVLISSRARTFQEAYQLGGVVILPSSRCSSARYSGGWSSAPGWWHCWACCFGPSTLHSCGLAGAASGAASWRRRYRRRAG